MIFVYNLCPASRKCQYLTSGFERCDGAQVRLLLIVNHEEQLESGLFLSKNNEKLPTPNSFGDEYDI